jgi:hypothetical protein
MAKISPFDVFARMTERNDTKLKLAPLNNILSARAVKAGTQVTIGVEGNICGQIVNGDFVGGLILCDKVQFHAIKAEMEHEAEARASAAASPQEPDRTQGEHKS